LAVHALDTMDSLFEIALKLPTRGSRQASSTVYRQLKAAILEGRLKPGTKLPATRKSDEIFGISRNTAAEVYEKLQHEGYVAIRHGSGTFVADGLVPPPPGTFPQGTKYRL